jgi:hypothetical protein
MQNSMGLDDSHRGRRELRNLQELTSRHQPGLAQPNHPITQNSINVRGLNLARATYFASQAIAQISRVPINGHNLEVLSCHTLRPCR